MVVGQLVIPFMPAVPMLATTAPMVKSSGCP